MELTKKQKEVLEFDSNLLVTGGPGSGKTTVSILKAAQVAAEKLNPQQKVLFLSFARASVSRVIEAIKLEQSISAEIERRITVETYHSFFWRVLKAYGYLIGLPRRLEILTPPMEAVALSNIRNQFKADNKLNDEERAASVQILNAERRRLAHDEGLICFDLFAPLVGDLLHGSERLRNILATTNPLIIVDEFQDTNTEQWRVVIALGLKTNLIALADPEQRIFDFIGADPQRLDHFREAFEHSEIDFGKCNHRSPNTDIAKFANEILTGDFTQKEYSGIYFQSFDAIPGPAMTELITTVYKARDRLKKQCIPNWSVAILVPTKQLTRLVSDSLRNPPAAMQPIAHTAVVELEAAILGSEIIAWLMMPETEKHRHMFIDLLCNYYHGKGGARPTKKAIAEATSIRRAFDKWCTATAAGKHISRTSIMNAMFSVYDAARGIKFTGNPEHDWSALRDVMEGGSCKRLKEIGAEIRNIRLLDRGTVLRQDLTEDWRNNNCYANALSIVRQTFVQQHFAASSKPESGIIVMNMHKAKGKQFDEVIIFEGWPRRSRGKIVANIDRIVRGNEKETIDESDRQNFRVSITRGRQRTSILTPACDPCVLLLDN